MALLWDKVAYQCNIFFSNVLMTGFKCKINCLKYTAQTVKNYLTIYGILGQEVLTLVNEQKEAGRYLAELNAANFASGV